MALATLEELKSHEIHIYSRIVGLADVFDALGNKRIYKEPWPQKKILDYIWKKKGGKFDPLLVDLLFDHLDEISRVREQFPNSQRIGCPEPLAYWT